MKITPAVLAASYDLLRETAPFDDWNLPPSEDVQFAVTRRKDVHGDYTWLGGDKHRIRISARCHTYLPALIATMGHELIHMHMRQSGMKGGDHGRAFHKLAAEVCKVHGLDPGQF
jgi:predicted SprT family Zn-dependent metalloprotease